ncbi:MAG: hypothetical protein AABX97_10640 [Candidatus Thermoplasmatota archaeon]
MAGRGIEWSFHKDRDLSIEIWSTAALLEAVIAALLDDPEKLRLALESLTRTKAP